MDEIVTVDAAVLCLKSGNAVTLRGGSEARSANSFLARSVAKALAEAGLDAECATFVENPDREVIQILKRHPELIDLIIPRGGKALKDALEGSAVPLLPHFDGLCHTYVDRAADLKMAEEICLNAKCSRPSVCNAMETMLVHSAIAERFLPPIATRLKKAGVEIRGDERTRRVLRDARPVRGAIEVDTLVSERGADLLEVPDGEAGGVVPDVRARGEQGETGARACRSLRIARTPGKVLGFGALEGIGAAGTALIDENDVALAQDAGESSRHACIESARRGAGC